MTHLNRFNPIVIFLYFLATSLLAAFGTDAVITLIFLSGSLCLFLVVNEKNSLSKHISCLILFLISALINPVFNHRGVTPLVFINDNPVTLEALLYGVFMAATVVAVIYWYFVFSSVMTADRLIYIFGLLSSKAALLFSMALRYIPLFVRQHKKVRDSQKALGLYNDGNIVDRFKGSLRVFSVMVTWGLENGIITADSMNARGFNEKKRTSFSFFSFGFYDFVLLLLTVVLSSVTVYGKISGITGTQFYPEFIIGRINLKNVLIYSSFFVLTFLPSIIELGERLRWKYLMSKI